MCGGWVGQQLASIDPGPSIGSVLASVDPGPSIGSGLADVDDFVNDEIPGGWVTVASVAAPYAAPYVTGAALTAGQAAALAAGVSGTGSVIRGDSLEEALKNAAIAGATSYGLNTLTSAGGESLALPSETPYIDLPDGEFLLSGGASLPSGGSSLLGPTYAELGLTGAEGGLAGPTYGELGLTGLELGTEASTGAPIFDYSQEVILTPSGNYIPANTLPSEIAGLDAEILRAGEAAIKAAPVSPSQAVNALRGVSSLLGGDQPGTPGAAAAQFRGSAMPQGGVDYSGILNLLQSRMPQRNLNSLLG